jgi:hypothetical protein
MMMLVDKAFFISLASGMLLARTIFSDITVSSHYVAKDHVARRAWSFAVLFSFGAFIYREGSHVPLSFQATRFAMAWQPFLFKDVRNPYIIVGLIIVTLFIYEYSSPLARMFTLPLVAWYGFVFGSIYKDTILRITKRFHSSASGD